MITLWTILSVGLLLSLGFVNKEQDAMLCSDIEINVAPDKELYFIDQIDIRKLLISRGDSIIGQPRFTVNVTELENVLNSHAAIANAEVFIGINGKLTVNIKQRKPVIRIINADGDSYYLDEEGTLMPLSDKYTMNVLVANGLIMEPYAKRYQYSAEQIGKDTLLGKISMLDDLFEMAKYIRGNEFWRSQVQQIYVNSEKDIELVPMAGDQKIIFGDTTFMDEKFKKLMTFYQQGLNTTGWWDKYSVINLKFKNQIVCTKK
ncbi:MAG: hypothetical protein M3R27_02070 [Bacteroidota bacterium]|nr:hypothetical protein [Bacteroidota bacterium]